MTESGQWKLTFEFDDLDGEILLAYTEDLEVAEDRLLGFGMTVDFDTEEVALVLPVKFTLNGNPSALSPISFK